MLEWSFNSQQLLAATIIQGPALVIAGPGSGKTRVIIGRISHLIEQKIAPHLILGLTFTNKAAKEMQHRIELSTREKILISTFHSLGVKILKQGCRLGYFESFNIYDDEDSEKLIRDCFKELNIEGTRPSDIKSIRSSISQAKNALQSWETEGLSLLTKQVYQLYEQKLREYKAVDFDDLLFLPVKLWKEYPAFLQYFQQQWQYILVDEYQDTNRAQYEMIRLLAYPNYNLFVVGDPDQNIYSWRGSTVQNILNFEKDFPGAQIIYLEQSYRNDPITLEIANAVISHNRNRYPKKLWSAFKTGEKVKIFTGQDDREEAAFVANQIQYYHTQGIPFKEMVIFYRTNAQSRIFEDYLISLHIPYRIVGGISFYQRKEIKDVLAFLRVVHSGADFLAFVRTLNIPARGFGEATIQKIRHEAALKGFTVFHYCEELAKNVNLPQSFRLSNKQKASLLEYVEMISYLRRVKDSRSLSELVKATVDQAHYLTYLKEDKDTYEDRKQNIDELIAKAADWEALQQENATLESFLEEFSLKSSLDELTGQDDYLNLMTIHNGKGLEFTTVFIVGLEENLFPLLSSKTHFHDIEEERCLCYVALTRSKKYVYLSWAKLRYMWGKRHFQEQSRFLNEMPRHLLEKVPSTSSLSPSIASTFPSTKLSKISSFKEGDLVFHSHFGIGEVKEVFLGSLGLSYKISFSKDHSLRTLVAEYAPLEKLDA